MILEDYENLKDVYENYWKSKNEINTSIKLPLTVSINSKQNKKIQIFEKTLSKIDLVSYFDIVKFDNQKTYFKIIYNGSPKKFIDDLKENNIIIISKNLTWGFKMKDLNQLLLNFDYEQNFKDDDFYVGKSNFYAFELINNWPKWEKNFLNISGEKFSGKTHLTNIFLNSRINF